MWIERQDGYGCYKNFENYYVSYNPMNDPWMNAIGFTNGTPETALCIDGEYYILEGDWREQYDACKTLEEALQLYRDNREHSNFWSSNLNDD